MRIQFLKKIINEEIIKILKENSFGRYDWTDYYIRDGELWDDKNKVYDYKGKHKPFKSVEEAEKWLKDNNERGSVIGFYNILKTIRNK